MMENNAVCFVVAVLRLCLTCSCIVIKVVKIAIQIVESYDSEILQGSSVPEYGQNRFLVVAGEIEGETRRIGGIASENRSCCKPEISGRVSTRNVESATRLRTRI
jgi:hypothetical protein